MWLWFVLGPTGSSTNCIYSYRHECIKAIFVGGKPFPAKQNIKYECFYCALQIFHIFVVSIYMYKYCDLNATLMCCVVDEKRNWQCTKLKIPKESLETCTTPGTWSPGCIHYISSEDFPRAPFCCDPSCRTVTEMLPRISHTRDIFPLKENKALMDS